MDEPDSSVDEPVYPEYVLKARQDTLTCVMEAATAKFALEEARATPGVDIFAYATGYRRLQQACVAAVDQEIDAIKKWMSEIEDV